MASGSAQPLGLFPFVRSELATPWQSSLGSSCSRGSLRRKDAYFVAWWRRFVNCGGYVSWQLVVAVGSVGGCGGGSGGGGSCCGSVWLVEEPRFLHDMVQ